MAHNAQVCTKKQRVDDMGQIGMEEQTVLVWYIQSRRWHGAANKGKGLG